MKMGDAFVVLSAQGRFWCYSIGNIYLVKKTFLAIAGTSKFFVFLHAKKLKFNHLKERGIFYDHRSRKRRRKH